MPGPDRVGLESRDATESWVDFALVGAEWDTSGPLVDGERCGEEEGPAEVMMGKGPN